MSVSSSSRRRALDRWLRFTCNSNTFHTRHQQLYAPGLLCTTQVNYIYSGIYCMYKWHHAYNCHLSLHTILIIALHYYMCILPIPVSQRIYLPQGSISATSLGGRHTALRSTCGGLIRTVHHCTASRAESTQMLWQEKKKKKNGE